MTDEDFLDYGKSADPVSGNHGLDISEILSSLSEQEDKEIERLEQKLRSVRQQLEEEKKVLQDNLEVIYRQIEAVQDQLRELDAPGYKPDSDIKKERELRNRLEDLYGDVRREQREWRRDRQEPLKEERELEKLIDELSESESFDELI